MTGIVIYKYEIREDKKMVSMGQLIAKLFIVSVIAFIILLGMYFFMGDSGAGDGHVSIRKKLHVTIKDNNPCFYVDSYEGIDNFEVYRISVTKLNDSPKASESYWCVGFCGDKHTQINIPFSALEGVDQCIQYGVINEVFSASAKKLETDTLYNIEIEGSKKNIPLNNLKDGDEVDAELFFQLVKNPKTGEIQALTK
ncbi:MAG: hypothetical protein PHT88_05740 [Candidatus Moranbacteria bacterium]|nr:hypothetical protein [Candidatus Moranbacteria bacterium]